LTATRWLSRSLRASVLKVFCYHAIIDSSKIMNRSQKH
jgi:hypothetical protein